MLTSRIESRIARGRAPGTSVAYSETITVGSFDISVCSVPRAGAETNGDCWGCAETPPGVVIVLADGTGSHPPQASQMAVAVVLEELMNGRDLLEALLAADKHLAAQSLVSTAVICVIDGKGMLEVVSAGDSEAWGIRSGSPDAMFLSARQGRRRVGTEVDPRETTKCEMPSALVLASDGVTRSIDMSDVCDMVVERRSNDAVGAVLEAIWDRRGDNHDDATVIYARRIVKG